MMKYWRGLVTIKTIDCFFLNSASCTTHGIHPDSPVGKRFAELPISVQHSTAGNGVHFAVVGFFLAWVLAFSRPVASADSAGGGGSASAASASGGADLSDPLAG